MASLEVLSVSSIGVALCWEGDLTDPAQLLPSSKLSLAVGAWVCLGPIVALFPSQRAEMPGFQSSGEG